MRFITYRIDNQHSFGAVIENRVVDLDRRMKSHDSLLEVIHAGALIRAKDIAAESSADYELNDIEFCQPILKPGKVVCVPASERSSQQQPAGADFYLRPAESLTGHNAALLICEEYRNQVVRPALALVVGNGGWRIGQKQTRDAIAGIALANNAAVQNWQEQPAIPAQGTTFPSCAATGPWLVTLDDIEDASQIQVSCSINDEQTRHFSSAQLARSLPEQISYLSHFMQLDPGDLIILELPEVDTGLPGGCHAAAGDQILLQSEQLGTLSNNILAEPDCRDNAD